MTSRLTKHPIQASHFVELVYSRDLSEAVGEPEVEVDHSVSYFVGEPEEWQIIELIPNGWTGVEWHVVQIAPEEPEDDGYLGDPDTLPGGADFESVAWNPSWETEPEPDWAV